MAFFSKIFGTKKKKAEAKIKNPKFKVLLGNQLNEEQKKAVRKFVRQNFFVGKLFFDLSIETINIFKNNEPIGSIGFNFNEINYIAAAQRERDFVKRFKRSIGIELMSHFFALRGTRSFQTLFFQHMGNNCCVMQECVFQKAEFKQGSWAKCR